MSDNNSKHPRKSSKSSSDASKKPYDFKISFGDWKPDPKLRSQFLGDNIFSGSFICEKCGKSFTSTVVREQHLREDKCKLHG